MKHEEAGLLLEEFARGQLPEVEHREVATHVADCASCREILEMYEGLRAAIRVENRLASGAHPTTEDLVGYALGNAGLSDQTRAAVAAHITSCSECDGDAAVVLQAEQEARTLPIRAARGTVDVGKRLSWQQVWAIAASVLVAILAYPAWLGVSTRHHQSSNDSADSVGPAALLVVSPATRGDEGAREVHIGGEHSSVVIAVEPVVLSDDADPDQLRVTLSGASGRTIREWTMSVGDVRRRVLESQGMLFFTLAAAELHPGRYVLVEVSPDRRERLRAEFVVIGESDP